MKQESANDAGDYSGIQGCAGGKGNAKAERKRDQEYIQSGGKVVPEKEFALISLPSLSGQITHWTSVVRPLS